MEMILRNITKVKVEIRFLHCQQSNHKMVLIDLQIEPFQLEKMQDTLRNQLDNEEEYEDQDYMKNERGSTPRATVTYIF